VANPFPQPGETIKWSGPAKTAWLTAAAYWSWFVNGKPLEPLRRHAQQGWAEGKERCLREGGRYAGDWKRSLQDGNGRYDAPSGVCTVRGRGGWPSFQPPSYQLPSAASYRPLPSWRLRFQSPAYRPPSRSAFPCLGPALLERAFVASKGLPLTNHSSTPLPSARPFLQDRSI